MNGQQPSAFAHRGEIQHFIPKASTDIASGDYVVMARNVDPISRAVLGAEGRISPAATAWACQWGVGVVDGRFTTNTVGATLYAAPTIDQALPVIRKGVVRFAIKETSGKEGDLVILSTATSGGQVFTINNMRRDVAVGRIWTNFSSATTGDLQLVELIEKPIAEKDIYFWLQNRPIHGCRANKHSVNSHASTQINMGMTNDLNNVFIVKGKMNSAPRVTDFVMGSINPGGQSAIRFYWLAAKVSTTGSACAFTKETCTGPFSAFSSWTVSGISVGMMIPITWNSNMVPIGLVVGWSLSQVSIKNVQILNLGNNALPFGQKVVDHTKWHL